MEQAALQIQNPTPSDMIAMAIDKNLDVDKLERLMEMKERHDREVSRKLFLEALSKFQSQCPEIRKNKEVDAPLKDGGKLKYSYAPLSDIERQIKDLMRECGLTKRWETVEDQTKITVTCIITHTSGHSERTSMTATPDDSGKKNTIQARGSSFTYMQRYTLIGALGIGTADNDIDGRFNEKDVDELHKDYMKLYNELIQKNPSFERLHPDNWRGERNVRNYIRAIGELRKLHYDEMGKNKNVQ